MNGPPMNRLGLGIAALVVLAAAPARAEVISADAQHFDLRQSVQLVVPPAALFAAFARIDQWWSPAHSYSGDARNLRLTLAPGGCFCERFPGGGGIEHLRVTYVDPGKRVVLTGALGPLLYEAVTAVMDVTVAPIAGGARLTLSYRAAGFAGSAADKLAPQVDRMLGEQVKRLRSYAAAAPRRTEPIP